MWYRAHHGCSLPVVFTWSTGVSPTRCATGVSTTLGVVFIHYWVHSDLTDLTPSLVRCMLNVALSTSLGVLTLWCSPCYWCFTDQVCYKCVRQHNTGCCCLYPLLGVWWRNWLWIRPQVLRDVTRFPWGSFCTTQVLRQSCDVHLVGKNVLISHVIC